MSETFHSSNNDYNKKPELEISKVCTIMLHRFRQCKKKNFCREIISFNLTYGNEI